MRFNLLLLILLLFTSALAAVPQSAKKPLTKDQVMALVKGSVPGPRVVDLIKENGIDFQPTDDYIRALRAAHADPAILDALRAAGAAKTSVSTGVDQAKQQTKAANALMDTGDIDGAIALYKQAVQSNPNDSDAHRLLGIALGKKNDWQGDIAEQRAAILANPDDAAAKDELAAALKASTEAQTSDLQVESSPDAEVYLNDEFKGRTSPEGHLMIQDLKPGDYKLRVSHRQKKDFEQTISLLAGQHQTIQAALADLMGSINVQTTPGAEVFLDSTSKGMADSAGSFTITPVSLGDHDLRISAGRKKDFHQTITVGPGKGILVDAPLADATGSIVVQTNPGAGIAMDNTPRGTADASGLLTISDVVAGTYGLTVNAKGKKEFQQNVTVTAGEETRIDAPLVDLPPTPGMVRQNPKDELNYAWIPPGTFMMGCSPGESRCNSEERPVHLVRITKGFWMGQLEVPVAAFKKFSVAVGRSMPEAPDYNPGWKNDRLPMVKMTWGEAKSYCTWAGGRLPSEAEWEYAARGQTTQSLYGPVGEISWYAGNTGGDSGVPQPGGLKRSNAFGMYDMLGNVREWTNDWFDRDYYDYSPPTDPPGPTTGKERVARGRSWRGRGEDMRVSFRGTNDPDQGFNDVGFRCVCDAINP